MRLHKKLLAFTLIFAIIFSSLTVASYNILASGTVHSEINPELTLYKLNGTDKNIAAWHGSWYEQTSSLKQNSGKYNLLTNSYVAWTTTDHIAFAGKQYNLTDEDTMDFSVVVDSQSAESGTLAGNYSSGLMIRESLDPSSKMAYIHTRGKDSNTLLVWRNTTGKDCGNGDTLSIKLPVTYKFTVTEGKISVSYKGADQDNFTTLKNTFKFDLSNGLYVGIAGHSCAETATLNGEYHDFIASGTAIAEDSGSLYDPGPKLHSEINPELTLNKLNGTDKNIAAWHGSWYEQTSSLKQNSGKYNLLTNSYVAWTTTDHIAFAGKQYNLTDEDTMDFSVVVDSQSAESGTLAGNYSSGLMIRESLDPSSKMAYIHTRTDKNDTMLVWRNATGKDCSSSNAVSIKLPITYKFTVTEGKISVSYKGADQDNFTTLKNTFKFDLSNGLYVGIAGHSCAETATLNGEYHDFIASGTAIAEDSGSLYDPSIIPSEPEEDETLGSSGKIENFNQTFTEDWENGINGDKWDVLLADSKFSSDFEVKSEKDSDGKVNKYLTWKKYGTLLTVNDEYWPVNGIRGDIATLSFRMKVENPYYNLDKAGGAGNLGFNVMSTGKFKDEAFGLWMMTHYLKKPIAFWGCDSWNKGSDTQFSFWTGAASSVYYPFEFDYTNWFNVKIELSRGSQACVISIEDKDGQTQAFQRYNRSSFDGKLALGYRTALSDKNTEATDNILSIDDIKVTFAPSPKDTETAQKDVNVYYSGNTFYKPGESVTITGEQLGSTVGSMKIKKLVDDITDVNNSDYILEQSFDTAASKTVSWDELNTVEGSEIPVNIVQTTKNGINIDLPDGTDGQPECYKESGMYAIYIQAKNPNGKDAIVIVNNPQVTQIMGDDGSEATIGGELRLSGYNLSVQNDISKVSAVVYDSNGNKTLLDNSLIYADTTENNNGKSNDYYLKIKLPQSFGTGDYKISIHNGFGGDNCWSAPVDFKIKEENVAASWRARGTFNVCDFGAKGDGKTNDTAAILSALAAADKNGGGIVYLPKNDVKNSKNVGVYLINYTLHIPRNVSLVGDGSSSSAIIYEEKGLAHQNDLLVCMGNAEIADLYIVSSSTIYSLKNANGAFADNPGNVYVHGVRHVVEGWRRTSQGVTDSYLQGNTHVDARNWVTANYKGAISYKEEISSNYLSFKDSSFDVENSTLNGARFSDKAKYLLMDNFLFKNYNNVGGNVAFIENSVIGTPHNSNNEAFFRNCSFSQNFNNNSELMLNDGTPVIQKTQVQSIRSSYTADDLAEAVMYAELVTLEETLTKDGKTEAEIAAAKNELVKQVLEYVQNKGTDCVYRDLYSKPNAGNYIFITQGQGTGQTRKVIDSINIGSYTYFTLEEPFIVSPNRNSICMFFGSSRNGAIITNSNFKNGRFVGHFGLNVNTVWDGNTLENSASGVSVNPFQAVSWYLTVKDNVSNEPFAVTAEGVMHQPMGACAPTGIANSFFAMNYRNNTVGQDGEITAFYSSNMYDEYAQNVVFENNVIVSDKSNFSVAQAGSSVDGIYLKNNCQYTDISDKDTEIGTYNNSAIKAIKAGKAAINSYGTSRIVCTDFEESSGTSIIGDVNCDGKVSLKDVSTIRYYLSGYNINIDLECADVNEDGFVDSRDLFGVRFIVLGYSNWKELIGITTSDGEEDPDDEQVSVILSDDFSSKEKSDGIWNWQAENARSAIINSNTRDSDGYITYEGTTKGVPGRQDAIPTMAKDYSFNPATDLDKRPSEVSFVVSSNYYASEYWADGMFIYPLIQCKDDWSSASYINVNAARGFATDYLSGNANYGKLTVEYIKSTGFSGGNGARPLIYLAEDTSKEEFLNYTMTYDWSDWENGNVTITYKICNLDGTPAKCNPDCENGNEAVVKYHFKDTDCNFTIGFMGHVLPGETASISDVSVKANVTLTASAVLFDDFSSKEKSDGIWNWQAENARSAIINSNTRDSDGYITYEGTTKGVPGRQDAIPTMAKDYSFNPATDLDKRPSEVSFVVSSNYYASEYWADGMFIYPLIQCKDDWSSASYINVNAARGFATDYLSGNANYGKLTVEYIKSTGFSGGNGARPLIYLAEDTSKEEFLNYTMTYDWSDWENGNVTITYKICNLDGTPAKCNPDCENGNEAVVKYHFKDTDCNFTIGFMGHVLPGETASISSVEVKTGA